MSGADRPDKGDPPEWTESDRAALDAIRKEREWDAELKRRRIERRESIKSWALWLTALSAAFTVVKDGVRAAWAALAPFLGRGP